MQSYWLRSRRVCARAFAPGTHLLQRSQVCAHRCAMLDLAHAPHVSCEDVPECLCMPAGSGSWVFPQPILDEALYRRECSEAGAD